MTLELLPYDAARYLDTEETISEYLSAALQSGNTAVLLSAVAAIARARGMAALAADTGLSRESLYKALRPGAQPRFDTIFRILTALNVQLTATPGQPGQAPQITV